jgi:hypothetical protein
MSSQVLFFQCNWQVTQVTLGVTHLLHLLGLEVVLQVLIGLPVAPAEVAGVVAPYLAQAASRGRGRTAQRYTVQQRQLLLCSRAMVAAFNTERGSSGQGRAGMTSGSNQEQI